MTIGKTWFPSPFWFLLTPPSGCWIQQNLFSSWSHVLQRQRRLSLKWMKPRLGSSGLAPFLSLSAPGSRDDTPTEQDKGGVECKQVKGAAGLSSMEQEPLGNPLNATEELKRHYWSHHSIDPKSPQTLELISLVFGGIRPPLPCSSSALVYSRLLSAMCSRLAVCPDRPPSSSSSSPAVCCWNSSFDRSPELEDFSSFWMSLLGSASVSSRRQHQHVDSLDLFSLMISITSTARFILREGWKNPKFIAFAV